MSRDTTCRVSTGHESRVGEIRLGLGSCCIAKGSGDVREALQQALAEIGLAYAVAVKRVGCVGMCHQTPLVEVILPNKRTFLYARVRPEDARFIVQRHFKPRGPIRKISNAASKVLESILTDRTWEPVTRYSIEVRDPIVTAFLGRQKHLATEHFGHINPTDLDDYLKYDGFKALNQCITQLTPEQVIEEIRRSGLRGRGGAGFPTALKWSRVRQAAQKRVSELVNERVSESPTHPLTHSLLRGMQRG